MKTQGQNDTLIRWVCIAVAALIGFDAATQPCADVNGDGAVTASDYFAYVETPADIDRDGDIDDDDGLLLAELIQAGESGPDCTPDGPVIVDGWTQFTPSPDTRQIHVAADGDDGNDGLRPESPVRTTARGNRMLRDNHPDWLLIRRGDTFNEALGGWRKSGRSESEPMVVTTYGEGPRPRLIVPDRGVSMVNHRERREHLAFVGLHFEGAQPGVGNGFVATGRYVKDILIEDCYFGAFRVNISFDVAGPEGNSENIRIRRNVIVDAQNDSHAQGIFADEVNGLLIEENIFDRNGWDHRIGRSDATIFAHNVYIQRSCNDVVFRGNISMRA
ncbi:MAG: hypothetical protein AAGF47_08030, partial [Planctomycetota bacterium]